MRHARQSVTVCEEAARAHPDSPNFFQSFLGGSLTQLATIELAAGHSVEAMKAAERLSEVAGSKLRVHPEQPEPRDHLIISLLIRGVILLKSGRAADASRVAEEAAEVLEGGRSSWPPGLNRFFHGVVQGFFYALGRPDAPSRPGEPPGLKDHVDRAIAEAREANRLGFRNYQVMTMFNEIIGRPAAMQVLLMDQRFPVDPFEPEPGSNDDGLLSDLRGITP